MLKILGRLFRREFWIYLRQKNIFFRDVESDTEAEIETVFIHPSYETVTGGGAENDIALIKLKKPVKLDQFIQPACLPYRFARKYPYYKLF